jgi:hypothetical protein
VTSRIRILIRIRIKMSQVQNTGLITIFVFLLVNLAFNSVIHTFFLVHYVSGVKNVSDDCVAGSIRLFHEPGFRLKM